MAVYESIPMGFRFSPTDSEILAYLESLILTKDDDQNHLKKDIVFYNFIRWADLYSMKPWELFNDDHLDDGYDVGDYEEGYGDLYLLTPLKKKTQNGSRIDRTVTTASSGNDDKEEIIGTWKLQTGPIDITDYKTGNPLGVKRAATFVPAPTKTTEDNEDQDAGTSSSCSSKKRKKAPEEMQGISYIMHEYTLYPSDDQVYSLCRIRRRIDKKMMTMIKKKKMRRSSSPTTNTTTYSTGTVVQADQEERAAGYDHHQQEVLNNRVSEIIDPYEENNIRYNDGQQQQQQQEAVVLAERDVQISDYGKRSIQEIEEFLFTEEVAAPAATTGGEENNICYNDGQQQQEAVLLPEGDVQISDDNKGLANAMEDIVYCGVILNEEFLSRLEQDVEESNNKRGLVTL